MDTFPLKNQSDDDKKSPAMYLYGHRFYIDQSPSELLSEFLLVLFSEKTINSQTTTEEYFPTDEEIASLSYKKLNRLLLKLICLSKDARGKTAGFAGFEKERVRLISIIENRIYTDSDNKKAAVDILTSLYQGFHTEGSKRDWCAQSFLPIAKDLIAGETIWKYNLARTKVKLQDTFDDFQGKGVLDFTSHVFYARGGEVLYLELLAALSQPRAAIDAWISSNPDYAFITEAERNPETLKRLITDGFDRCYKQSDVLKQFPDMIEAFRSEKENWTYTNALTGWIPADHWKYGYIFAVELSRLLKTSLDIMDMVRLLELACVLQVLRVMINSCAAYLGEDRPLLPIVSSGDCSAKDKRISNASYMHCLRLIKNAVDDVYGKNQDTNKQKYGHGLFKKLSKAIGFVSPPKGDNEHFVLTKDLLHLIVITTLEPDKSLSLTSFLNNLKVRYGFVFDNQGFNEANVQNNLNQIVSDPDRTSWLMNMLDEAGYFVELSDSLSLVKNTNNGVKNDV